MTTGTQPRVIGILLAGGESRRMGQDKASLPATSDASFPSLLAQQLDLLQQLPLERLWISRHQNHDALSPELAAMTVTDARSDIHLGPLAGIHSAILHDQQQAQQHNLATADAALIVPVDLPLLDKATISQLLTTGMQSGQACYFLQDYLPLYLPLHPPLGTTSDAATAQDITTYLERTLSATDADRSIRGLLKLCQPLSLQPADASKLTNTNTRDEWNAIQAQQGK